MDNTVNNRRRNRLRNTAIPFENEKSFLNKSLSSFSTQ